MAITGSLSNFQLDLVGDTGDDTIVVSRDAGGTIFVNGGAVAIQGGPPTITNTITISGFGFEHNDTITLDESNGPLPLAHLFGFDGNDTLSGGAGFDQLFGQNDDDTLFGKGGEDFLSGGSGNDTLTGGTGNDRVIGQEGDDRMIWNAGDGNDTMDGGVDNDTVEINGSNGGDLVQIIANGARINIDGNTPAAFHLDITATENIAVNGGDGNDTITAGNGLAALAKLTIDGGAGSDTILGSDGDDVIFGGAGNDLVTGGRGNDTISLGAGEDEFVWNPGDGSDTVDGGDDFDVLLFTASGANERIDISASGSDVHLLRDVGNVTMDLSRIERVHVEAQDGADAITVNDLSGTGVVSVQIGLTATAGSGGDNAADSVTVAGTADSDAITIQVLADVVQILGLSAAVLVIDGESADSLIVESGGGNDTIDAAAIPLASMALTLDGGAGNDVISGAAGADTLIGGTGIDTASYAASAAGVTVNLEAGTGQGGYAQGDTLSGFENLTGSSFADTLVGDAGNNVLIGGDGNDRLVGNAGNDTLIGGAGDDFVFWGPSHGSDIIDGGEGNDFLAVRGSDSGERFVLSANGTHVQIARDIDNTVLDVSKVESIELAVRSGADAVTVNDLGGTGVGEVDINLGLAPGVNVGDGSPDAVTLHGSGGGDSIIVQADSATISVAGLAAQVAIFNGTPEDTLVVSGDDGNDVIDATRVTTPVMALTLDGGAGNDVITGSAGADTVVGGAGNDTLIDSAGDDILVGGAGEDTAVFNVDFDTVRVSYVGSRTFIDSAEGHDEVTGIENFQFTDGTIHRNDGSPLVDDLFYYANNKDVWNAGVDANDHYNTYGWQEGRDPNAEFSTRGYLSANADVRAAHINPLLHFDQYGWLEGRDPSANFDTQLYLQKNPDVAAAHVDPLAQFEAFGRDEGRQTFVAIGSVIKNGFDAEYYLLVNPDVGFAGVDPYQHYATYGWQEGRNPNAFFDTKGYLAANPDVAAALINPLEHYMTYGASEGRNPSSDFDTTGYLAAFHDVAAAGVNPLQHFLQNGIFEGRGEIFA